MVRSKRLLEEIVAALVKEWGSANVQAVLAKIPNEQDGDGFFKNKKNASLSRAKRKLLAIEQVAQAKTTTEQQRTLLQIAEHYDQKRFLPTTSDVREFLFMLGRHPEPMKDRSQAFRRLLETLLELPKDRLDRIARESSHSGPSRLGPISDAISNTADSLRRSRSTDLDSE